MEIALERKNIVFVENPCIKKNNDFLNDVLACFEGQDTTLLPYLHESSRYHDDKVQGAKLWSKYYNDPAYYLPSHEMDTIRRFASSISNITKGYHNIVDLGLGSKEAVLNKTVPLLKQKGIIKKYYAVDLSAQHTEEGVECVKHHFSSIPIKYSTINRNFYESLDGVLPPTKNIGLFLGCTVANVPEERNAWIPSNMINSLARIRNNLGSDSFLIVSQDTNQNFLSLNKAYACKTAEIYNLNVMHRIQRDLNPKGFNPDLFKYRGIWNKKDLYYGGYAIATRKQFFMLGGKAVSVNKGQKICLYRSYKYSQEQFIKIGKAAGYKPLDAFCHQDGNIVLHVWKT